MSYINRMWVAAGVAAVNSHSDQGQKLKSGLKSLSHARNRFFSGNSGAADLRPLSSVLTSGLGGFLGGGDDGRKQAEESLRHVMYLNCWGQG